MVLRWVTAVALSAVIPVGIAAECTAKSGTGTAALIELYTSEGCSSCPPADQWVSRLPRAGFSPEKVVPLALHVDYWDYIGWKDEFAHPAFTRRQREIAALNNGRVIYTPQIVLSGRDYRGWSSARTFADAVQAINAKPSRAEIAIAFRGAGFRATANVPPRDQRADAALYVAAYESGLASQVTAGENRGVTLQHDFVVREWWGPFPLDAAGVVDVTRPINARGVARGGLAAFVQNRRTGEVLQALALPACG